MPEEFEWPIDRSVVKAAYLAGAQEAFGAGHDSGFDSGDYLPAATAYAASVELPDPRPIAGGGELMPCPFCYQMGDIFEHEGATGTHFAPSCTNDQCPAYAVDPSLTYSRRAEAAAAWNSRFAARQPIAPPSGDYAELLSRLNTYFACGGMFNPELADHVAVRGLLFDCRIKIRTLLAERDAAHAPVADDALRHFGTADYTGQG